MIAEKLSRAREALAEAKQRAVDVVKRITNPSPDDDPEAAHRERERAEWDERIASETVRSLEGEARSAELDARRAEFKQALERASLHSLWERTVAACATVRDAHRLLARASGEILAESDARDRAAARATELAAELGEPPPAVWGRLGPGAVLAMLLEDLAAEPTLPLNPSLVLRVMPVARDRAHAQLAAFGSPVVVGMSPEQLASHILEHGTDPRNAAAKEHLSHERAAKEHADRLERARKLRAERERKEMGERLAREQQARAESIQRATREQNQRALAERQRDEAKLLEELSEHERQVAANGAQ